ncbi:MAG TPA: ABC transporter permease [Jatrophihabitans sp.]|jgi:spermidine/putrescine transport system permease protein
MSARSIRNKLAPYALVFPGWVWLMIFFVVPIVAMLSVSTMTGNDLEGFKQTWHLGTYADAWNQFHDRIIRSLIYGIVATAICLLIGYPVAYWIAFRGGKYKSSLLFLLLLPFFVSFVIRTLSWQFMLGDSGLIHGALHGIHVEHGLFTVLRALNLADTDGQYTQTNMAVIGGLVYNFLPFAILPIYVSLERVQPVLLEASADLYASKTLAFLKVVFPLSIPGLFASVLLTFVPVASDYVDAQILGGTHQTMIGTVIDTQYITDLQYPTAAALSFILMAILLIGVFVYARVLGTEDALEMAAA